MIRVSSYNVLAVLISLYLIAGCKSDVPQNNVGVGETIITPEDPIGVPMAGFDRSGNTSEGVHDDLHARSIVVEDQDGSAVVMITVSLLSLSEEIMDAIRNNIEVNTGIPFEHVIISATHTHSGPTVGGIDSDYAQFVIEKATESAVQAWEGRVQGRIGVGSTDVYGLGMNRIALEHGGIIPDPEAGVIKVEDAGENLIGLFFNFGAHPATLDLHNLELSSDWPYFSTQGIKEEVGEDVIVGYFHGAAGEVNTGYSAELSAVGANMYGARSFEHAERKGHIMTDAVLELLPSIETSGDIEVEATYDQFEFPRRTTYPYTHEEALEWRDEARQKLNEMEAQLAASDYPTDREEAIEWQREARELVERGEFDSKNQIGPRVYDKYRADFWLAEQAVQQAQRIEDLGDDPEPIQMPMQSVRLGETVFVTFPNEVYSAIGLAVKEQSPFENTFIFSLAGEVGGSYIPTAADYLEGGYVANGTPFAPESEQILIDNALELIRRVE